MGVVVSVSGVTVGVTVGVVVSVSGVSVGLVVSVVVFVSGVGVGVVVFVSGVAVGVVVSVSGVVVVVSVVVSLSGVAVGLVVPVVVVVGGVDVWGVVGTGSGRVVLEWVMGMAVEGGAGVLGLALPSAPMVGAVGLRPVCAVLGPVVPSGGRGGSVRCVSWLMGVSGVH